MQFFGVIITICGLSLFIVTDPTDVHIYIAYVLLVIGPVTIHLPGLGALSYHLSSNCLGYAVLCHLFANPLINSTAFCYM